MGKRITVEIYGRSEKVLVSLKEDLGFLQGAFG